MGIKEQLANRPKTTVGAAIVVILASMAFSMREYHTGGRPDVPPFHDQAFYTTDQGTTLFTDSVLLYPPIDHNGAPAVRAWLYSCDGGKTRWVQYLEKYKDADKAALEASARPSGVVQPLVKLPDKGDWVAQQSPQGAVITHPKSPDGAAGLPMPVYP